MDYISLLGLRENELHLPVWGKRQLFETAVKVMQTTKRVNLCLHWNGETTACQDLNRSLLESLPYLNTLRYVLLHVFLCHVTSINESFGMHCQIENGL